MHNTFAKGQSLGRPAYTILLAEIESLESLSFSIEIEIQRIILEEHDRVFYEPNIVATNQMNQFVEWATNHNGAFAGNWNQ